MICDVPDEVIKSVRMGTWCGSSVVEKMIASGTPLPDNATNGDVIKALFKPNWIRRMDDVVREEYEFNKDWWNSPYQKGGKE